MARDIDRPTNRSSSLYVNLGYYSDERGIKIKDLAESMGMARSTMGGHLKLIEQSVMSKVVDDLG